MTSATRLGILRIWQPSSNESSLSDISHNTVSSSKIPQHQSTSSASNSLVSNTSQLKLHEFSSTKSTFSSNSQKFFSNLQVPSDLYQTGFLFIKIISSLLIFSSKHKQSSSAALYMYHQLFTCLLKSEYMFSLIL